MLTGNQEQLVYWINERESMRLKKEAGMPPPWSDNPVMQETYFCNVNREDDRVTKWIRSNWTYQESHKVDFFYNLIAMATARLFNLPSTLKRLGQPRSENIYDWFWKAEALLVEKKDKGEKIWNGAYIVSTNGKKMCKITYCLQVLENIRLIGFKALGNCRTLQDVHNLITQVDGIGSFIGAQIIADLKNTEGHPLQKAPDWWTFSSSGPGSLRGLEWFFEEKVTNKNYQQKINEAMDIMYYSLPDEILKFMCMQNFQNCFCEYDKFMRVSNGTGRSKRKYIAKRNEEGRQLCML